MPLDYRVHLFKKGTSLLQVSKVAVQYFPVGIAPNHFPGGPANRPNKFLPGPDPLGAEVAGKRGSTIEDVMELMHNV